MVSTHWCKMWEGAHRGGALGTPWWSHTRECRSLDDYYFCQMVASWQLVLHPKVIIPFSQFVRDFIYLYIFCHRDVKFRQKNKSVKSLGLYLSSYDSWTKERKKDEGKSGSPKNSLFLMGCSKNRKERRRNATGPFKP